MGHAQEYYLCFFLTGSIEAMKDKNYEVRGAARRFYQRENKGLFNDGISGKFAINLGSLGASLSLLYCVASQVLTNRFIGIPTGRRGVSRFCKCF